MVLCIVAAGLIDQELIAASEDKTDTIPIRFSTEGGWTYDGKIELPPARRNRGWAAMMLGGGLGGPIDWSVPGIMTIDGNPTRDGDTIAHALLEAGFVVMRWNAIRRDDPIHAEDAMMFDPPSFEQTIEQARLALAAFREKRVVADDNIFLLGHSLGARRATILLDDNPHLPGIIMLAGASLIPSDLEHAQEIGSSAHLDPIVEDESQFRIGIERFIDALKKEKDSWLEPMVGERDKYNQRFGAYILAERHMPTLALVGALDERWLVEGCMLTAYLRAQGAENYTFKAYPKLGHQLGPEVSGAVIHPKLGEITDSRVGPIDAEVIKDIVSWLSAELDRRQLATGKP